MKVIYILSGTSMQGGATKSFLNLLCKFCKEGNSALVVCPDKDGIYQYLASGSVPNADPLCLNYTYDILPFVKKKLDYLLFLPRLVKRIIKNRIASISLVKHAMEFKADLIHSNTSVNNIGYLVAKYLHIPHIWHIREYGKRDFNMIVPFQYSKLTSRNNYIITITDDIAKYKHIQNLKTTRTIYNGIISEDSLRYSVSDGKYFLYAGRVTKNKGIFDLLEAYNIYVHKAMDKRLPLYIVGNIDYSNRNNIEKYCKINKIKDYVNILGPKDNIHDLMFRAAATIVPSYFEGFGRVLPEAMANGSLTVGRDTGGTKEQYDNGVRIVGKEIGIRFNSTQELADALFEIATHPKSYYNDIISSSQIVVNNLYSTQNYSKNVMEYYNQIINKLF